MERSRSWQDVYVRRFDKALWAELRAEARSRRWAMAALLEDAARAWLRTERRRRQADDAPS